MSEPTSETPTAPAPKPEPPFLEILQKFAKGDISLGKDTAIQGEGLERKIIVKVPQEDPDYVNYLEKVKSSTETYRKAAQIVEGTEVELKYIAQNVANRILYRHQLDESILTSRISLFVENELEKIKEKNASEAEKETEGKQPKIKPIEEMSLSEETQNLIDLFEYTQYLVELDAYEVLLPEQQIQQVKSQK